MQKMLETKDKWVTPADRYLSISDSTRKVDTPFVSRIATVAPLQLDGSTHTDAPRSWRRMAC